MQYFAPIAWSTLELTVHADGRSERRLVGASPFPRHWVYDDGGALIAKSGLIDYKDWAGKAFGKHTPWGDEESPALVSAVETALERKLAGVMMHGAAKPTIRTLKAGTTLTEQGAAGGELFLLLDGVLVVDVDGTEVAEVGPGAVLGERAELEGGHADVHVAAPVPPVVSPPSRSTPSIATSSSCSSADHRHEEQLERDLIGTGRCACTCAACGARHRRRAGVHPRRRAHVVRRHRPSTASGARACCSTAGPGCAESPSCSAMPRSKAPCCSATCTGTTPRASRSSAPVTDPTPASTSTFRSPTATPPTALDGLMAPPFFPIDAGELHGQWSFQALDEGTVGGRGLHGAGSRDPAPRRAHVRLPRQRRRRSIAYVSDHGPIALGPGPDGWGPYHDAVCELADGVDVLLHDAQFTAAELAARPHFGHSAVGLRGGPGRALSRRSAAALPP